MEKTEKSRVEREELARVWESRVGKSRGELRRGD